jgi:ribose 5-phosphate isomerase A
MRVGLGTGSTVAHLLPAIAARGCKGPALRGYLAGDRAQAARALGLTRSSRWTTSASWTSRSTAPTRSTRAGWLIKGGGGRAHAREDRGGLGSGASS